MRPKLVLAAAAAALSISLLGATGASAATEFGDPCVANEAADAGEATLIQLAAPSPLPLAAPTGGVITSWKLSLITPESEPIPPIITQSFKVMRVNPALKTAQTVAEDTRQVGSGINSFQVRIPVQTGDRLALFGPGGAAPIGTLFCQDPGSGSLTGVILGSAPNGSTSPYELTAIARVPVVATLEPDADNDGFGDETQDACPQSATTQAPCPVVTLSTSKQVRKGSVTIVVTTSTPATITVKGVAKLGKGKKAKLSGGTQILAPGLLGKFRLGFSKALKNKLKELPPKRSVRLNVTVSGTSVSGAVTKKTLKLKLKGQAKPPTLNSKP